jgi:hypothetical protein
MSIAHHCFCQRCNSGICRSPAGIERMAHAIDVDDHWRVKRFYPVSTDVE